MPLTPINPRRLIQYLFEGGVMVDFSFWGKTNDELVEIRTDILSINHACASRAAD